ncbi:putative cofD-like protein [Orenia metallireducens]|uniref:Putative gluconeogenesis factor n=1 Tax=Orenia metallireducens TaxID=1413210 RepID=A0A285H823_9FIRM|nr:YvcK family protein [Orenia metallireducens]PRX28642.1 putative cofD-like protein [Orenia metallireducens]SNY30996.1 conserved hypothetical protein, cofD-related [Orenia metallireducens]
MNRLKWLYPGLKLKRWIFLMVVGVILVSVGVSMAVSIRPLDIIRYRVPGIIIVLFGIYFNILAIRRMLLSVYDVLSPERNERLIEVLYQERYRRKGPKIVVVGGGTGLSTMLRGIKKFTNNITAIVTVADDGGSSGVLRDELGILPPGDIRNCLVALADTEPLMERLFQYRFSEGKDLKGHSFGNIFIATLAEILGNFEEAVKESSKILAIKGRVLPSTLEDVRLSARLESGELIKGESQIPKIKGKIDKVFIDPEDSKPLPEALEAIKEADAIILGPGSLYTSVLPNLLVKDLTEEIKKSDALKLYICNVMTQAGETDDYNASDHLQALYDHVGSEIVDYILVNNERISADLIEKYGKEGSRPVEVDLAKLKKQNIEVVQESVISQSNVVRHDPEKLARVLIDLIFQKIRGY